MTRPGAVAGATGAPSDPAASRPAAPGPTGTGSFLDEWLAKRQSGQAASAAPAAATPPPAPATSPTPAPTPTPAPAPTPTTNISSDELEQQEVHQIAEELKQELGNNPAAPMVQTIQAVPGSNEGEISLTAPESKPGEPKEAAVEEDTIVIDHDGSFHQTNEPTLK